MSLEIREANLNDWDKLSAFFLRIYREDHPLLNKEFWKWQYGEEKYGRSFICIKKNREIVGHIGATFGGGVAWIINVFLLEEYRGKGIIRELYNLARKYYPLGATAANKAGLDLYRNMGWIRYYDLIRLVKLNPNKKFMNIDGLCGNIEVSIKHLRCEDSHYFRQPGLNGIRLMDGSKGVSQEEVGGLRMVDIGNLGRIEEEAWKLGYNWIDYISSWNDVLLPKLENRGWLSDKKSGVPWRLNPLDKAYFCDITFLSEKPLGNNFVVHRSFSDHGRIGSLYNK